jgi:hypothetical protein
MYLDLRLLAATIVGSDVIHDITGASSTAQGRY